VAPSRPIVRQRIRRGRGLGTDPGRELLVGVTPTRPGRTVIQSHRIQFKEGWQQGSDDIHVEVVLKAH